MGSTVTDLAIENSESTVSDKFQIHNAGSIKNNNLNSPIFEPISRNACISARRLDSEIFIAGFMDLSDSDDIYHLCISILHGIIPSFSNEEIADVDPNNEVISKHPSVIVRLASIARTKQLLHAKKRRNYYSTMDIDRSILHEEYHACQTSKLLLMMCSCPQSTNNISH